MRSLLIGKSAFRRYCGVSRYWRILVNDPIDENSLFRCEKEWSFTITISSTMWIEAIRASWLSMKFLSSNDW